MKVLVTGSAGHLGEALVRTITALEIDVVGLDILPSPFTTQVGSIIDRSCVARCMSGVRAVFHSATLHKPHLGTHSGQQFVNTNITGTLTLLEEAVSAGVESFIFTSTTSVFGDALKPCSGTSAMWVTEDLMPIPRNIYGATKTAAEGLCQLFHRNHRLSCIVLRTSRFFLEADDDKVARQNYADANLKANEYLFRRVDLEDVVNAHLCAWKRAREIGFRRYIVSATTPFFPEDVHELSVDAPRTVRRRVSGYEAEYLRRGWKMHPTIDRVYVNERARQELGWRPRYDFNFVLDRLRSDEDMKSELAHAVGSKGYHADVFEDGPYPVDR